MTTPSEQPDSKLASQIAAPMFQNIGSPKTEVYYRGERLGTIEELVALSRQRDALKAALEEHHNWHLNQTERSPIYFGDTIGQVNADEYAESELCEITLTALRQKCWDVLELSKIAEQQSGLAVKELGALDAEIHTALAQLSTQGGEKHLGSCGHPTEPGWNGLCVLCARDIELGASLSSSQENVPPVSCAEPPREFRYDPTLTVPSEILAAARKIEDWTRINGWSDFWCIGPVCSRKYADHAQATRPTELEARIVKLIQGLDRVAKDRDDNHLAYCKAKEELAESAEEYREFERIRNGDLVEKLEFFQKNAGYYQSKLEAAQEQLDLYKREVESVIEYMPERFVVKLADHPFGTLAVSSAKLGHAALASVTLEEENKELRDKRTVALTAIKAAYARGHYCDMGERCPGCIAGHALEQITGRKWTQEECE